MIEISLNNVDAISQIFIYLSEIIYKTKLLKYIYKLYR